MAMLVDDLDWCVMVMIVISVLMVMKSRMRNSVGDAFLHLAACVDGDEKENGKKWC